MKLRFKLLGFLPVECEVGVEKWLKDNQVFNVKAVGISVSAVTGWVTIGVVYEEKGTPGKGTDAKG